MFFVKFSVAAFGVLEASVQLLIFYLFSSGAKRRIRRGIPPPNFGNAAKQLQFRIFSTMQ
ncbi:hypothetical protein K505DRAFT_319998 [Melanomma pulvis-pyrius CBS 109.77]|uniref:CSC1/OSCA1-like 7TM region domain-containing protein n=1 Tax=Melanomma pulvis-pyrius CBS 109.77 TaxID=1314802 RepID=A0A6A6XWV3_9PLEO|nr:hypothetical protein K505DRAFT_319998 [Melanomma pulvis-pyrius CBS 109.77]